MENDKHQRLPPATGKNHVNRVETGREVRPSTSRMWNEDSQTRAAKESFSRDTAKLWNMAPIALFSTNILDCKSCL